MEIMGKKAWMKLTRYGKNIIFYFYAGMLLCGVLHAANPPIHFLSQIYCIFFAILWAVSLNRRIIDIKQKRILLMIVFLIILLYTLQIAKYRMFYEEPDIKRHIWYAYYIPMIGVPVMIFCEALQVKNPEQSSLSRMAKAAIGIGIVMMLLILANDYHSLAFSFPNAERIEDESRKGILYVLAFLYIVGLLVAALMILLRCARSIAGGYLRMLPLVPIFCFAAYVIALNSGRNPRLGSYIMWNIGEVEGFAMSLFVECCIQIGLIPSNSDYGRLFKVMPLQAEITDRNGTVIFASKKAERGEENTGFVKHYQQKIAGGSVHWKTDVSELVHMEQLLKEQNEQLRIRRDYLSQGNRLKEEQERIRTKNMLYDRIAEQIQPQLQKVETLMKRMQDGESNLFPEIAVCVTYVKRRCNMELAQDNGMLSSEELRMAIYESSENLKTCGISAGFSANGKEMYPLDLITAVYDFGETVLEECLDSLKNIMINLNCKADGISLRLMLTGESLEISRGLAVRDVGEYQAKLTFSKEQDELLLALNMTKGGDI